jgi:hypothetical protein
MLEAKLEAIQTSGLTAAVLLYSTRSSLSTLNRHWLDHIQEAFQIDKPQLVLSVGIELQSDHGGFLRRA